MKMLIIISFIYLSFCEDITLISKDLAINSNDIKNMI